MTGRRPRWSRLLAVALALAGAGNSHALKCPASWGGQLEVQQKLAEASAVVVARVLEIGESLGTGASWNPERIARLKVERRFKGSVGDDVRIVLPEGSRVGQRLLLFARLSPPDERLSQTRGRWAARRQAKAESLPKGADGFTLDREQWMQLYEEARHADERVSVADADIPALTASGLCSHSVFPLSDEPAASSRPRTALPPAMGMSGDDMLWLLEATPPAGSGGQAWLTVDVMEPYGAISGMRSVAVRLSELDSAQSDAVTVQGPQGRRRFKIDWHTLGEPRPPLLPLPLPPGVYQIALPQLPGYALNCWTAFSTDDCWAFQVGDRSPVLRSFYYRPTASLSVSVLQRDGQAVDAAGVVRVRRLSPWPAGLPFRPPAVATDAFEQRGSSEPPWSEQAHGAGFTLLPGKYAVDLVMPKLAPPTPGEPASARRVASVLALPLRGGGSVEATVKAARFSAPVPAALKPATLRIRVAECGTGYIGVEMLTTAEPGELAVAQRTRMLQLPKNCEHVHHGYVGQTVRIRFDPQWNETLIADWVELKSEEGIIELLRTRPARWRPLEEVQAGRR